MSQSWSILGCRREERGGSIYISPTVSFGKNGGDYVVLEGRFCSKDELARMTPEQEDTFAFSLAKAAARKRFWKSLFKKLTFRN
jgi:hypothetical protein